MHGCKYGTSRLSGWEGVDGCQNNHPPEGYGTTRSLLWIYRVMCEGGEAVPATRSVRVTFPSLRPSRPPSADRKSGKSRRSLTAWHGLGLRARAAALARGAQWRSLIIYGIYLNLASPGLPAFRAQRRLRLQRGKRSETAFYVWKNQPRKESSSASTSVRVRPSARPSIGAFCDVGFARTWKS